MRTKNKSKSISSAVSANMSTHRQALLLQEYAATLGFDWTDINDVFHKLHEEITELQTELAANAPTERLLDEFGDILFVCINIARHLQLDPEQALRCANNKFVQRFMCMEEMLQEIEISQQPDLALLNQLWEQAKLKLKR